MDSLREIFLAIVKLWNEMAVFLLFGFIVPEDSCGVGVMGC